jgi:hypothetical protein
MPEQIASASSEFRATRNQLRKTGMEISETGRESGGRKK